MFRRPTTTPTRSAEALLGAPAAGFFAAGEIGPVGGEHFLHSFTATDRGLPVGSARRMELRGRTRPGDRRDRRPGRGDRPALAARGASPRSLTGAAPTCSSRSPTRPAAGRSRPTSPTRPTWTGCWPRRATSTCSSPTPGLPGQRAHLVVLGRGHRPRARGQPAGADGDGAPAGRADGRARLRAHRVRVLAVGQGRERRRLGLRGHEVRPARLRPRAARGPARQRASACRSSSRASSATAACSTTPA